MKLVLTTAAFLTSLALLSLPAFANSIVLNMGESVTIGSTVVSCGESPNTTCVPDCTARYGNGTCYSYGQDYCGPAAQCVAYCNGRYENGSCYSYGQDVCGTNPQCVQNCTARYSSGVCSSYGPDKCTTDNN